ncbi:7-deoxyloganetin glucosyltransferase-like [Neltuma alba]|uniref:7-deoxyloganetin glucosyltransferase-like n=1 Tax=Neltuma alba TaxID=207710 RepID=UPI0010A3114A|nr:7-deoxyloganetin glucosyltransferase-like [Prosopis alba]
MCDSSPQKPHIVCLPFPAQGHVNPFMKLAKLLHSNGFHVTFVNSEFIHKRLAQSLGSDFVKGLPDFRFETIPDGLPQSETDAQDIPALIDSTRKHCYGPLKELIGKLNSLSSSSGVPAVSCIIADANMGFAEKVADEFGIPEIRFWTASACGLLGYLQYDELVKRGIFPFKDENFANNGTSDATLDWVTGMKSIQHKDLPNFIRFKSLSEFLFEYKASVSEECMKSSSIIINTFQELESEVLEVIMAKNPNVYNIGPLQLLNRHFIHQEKENDQFKSSSGLSFWKSDSKCIQWLDQWKPSSVIYVNYGSIAVMTEQNLKEFAWGLAESRHPFLWIVRPNLVNGESNNETSNLPKEFLDEIKDRGYITSWCSQEQVLAHPSIGVFWTHCGWNSTIESICEGVPMICWPFSGEQPTNCWFACSRWGIGIEAKHEINREQIADIVKEAMEGDKGKEMRRMSLEWKMKAMEVTDEEGTAYKDFKRLMKERLFVTVNSSAKV